MMQDISDEDLDQYINRLQEETLRSVPHGENIDIVESNTIADPILPPGIDISDISLETLRRFAKHLIDGLFRKPVSIIPEDLYDYFDYSSQLVATSGQGDIENHEKSRLTRDRFVTGDFRQGVAIVLFGAKYGRSGSNFQREFDSEFPMFKAVNSDWGIRSMGYFSYPLLDGLIRRRCDIIEVTNGNLTETIQTRDGEYSPGFTNLAQKLYIWESVSPNCGDILAEIDDQYRYENLDVLLDLQLLHDSSIFQLINAHRNLNLHGENRTRIMSVVAMILCSLLVYESTPRSLYEYLLEEDRLSWTPSLI